MPGFSGLVPIDLVVTMTTPAILVGEEGTMSRLLGLSETIERRGCFFHSPPIAKAVTYSLQLLSWG
jgi:hypothetical protein